MFSRFKNYFEHEPVSFAPLLLKSVFQPLVYTTHDAGGVQEP